MNLLLLTSNFPYHPGEQFIENEIDILAENFEKIFIFPIHFNPLLNNNPPRPVPRNVEIFIPYRTYSKHSKIKIVFQTAGLLKSFYEPIASAISSGIYHPWKIYNIFLQYFKTSFISSLILCASEIRNVDIIYSYWGATVGLSLYFLKKNLPRHIVFASRLHNYDLYAERRNLNKIPFQEFLLDTCDLLAPCSEQGEEYLKKRYPGISGNVHCFHLGVATQSIINKGSTDDFLRIVTCSFIVPVKRLELLVSALMKVTRHVIWTHIGTGRGNEKEKLFQSLKDLPGNVQPVFLGHLDNWAVLDYYHDNPVDLFVNVSEYEGIPVSVMEALSFGIEPVATDVGGVSEVVMPGFGTLIPPDFRPELLSDIIQNHRNSMARRVEAQEYQRRKFSFANYQSFAAELKALSGRKF